LQQFVFPFLCIFAVFAFELESTLFETYLMNPIGALNLCPDRWETQGPIGALQLIYWQHTDHKREPQWRRYNNAPIENTLMVNFCGHH